MLQNKASNEHVARKGVKEELMKLEGSVSAFNEQAAQLPESSKSLKAACVEMASLKEHVVRADMEVGYSEKFAADVRYDLEQPIACLNVALVG